MAEILVRAVNNVVSPDADLDRRDGAKKGDVISVQPDGHQWGGLEGPPRFVLVKCPGLDHQNVRDRIHSWDYDLAFNVIASDPAQDGFRIRATNQTESPSGGARLTRAKVEAFLNAWGATVVNAGQGFVTFDVRILDSATSQQFWEDYLPIDGIVFTEDGYDQATGLHTITMDYSAHPFYLSSPQRAQQIARGAVQQRATFLVQGAGIITFSVHRSNVREAFRADVSRTLGTWRKHRYHFSEADVDTALAQGGVVTLTNAQLLNKVLDRTAE